MFFLITRHSPGVAKLKYKSILIGSSDRKRIHQQHRHQARRNKSIIGGETKHKVWHLMINTASPGKRKRWCLRIARFGMYISRRLEGSISTKLQHWILLNRAYQAPPVHFSVSNISVGTACMTVRGRYMVRGNSGEQRREPWFGSTVGNIRAYRSKELIRSTKRT